ncbi:MAG: LuxR C-terminal-related transcriptional regulator [Pseudomonadota bacterium]|jgi:DNA-binding CsgD family transcriptional regulator|nr:LuxR C-terminal-related transcriptional regulator [Pseudomonadota bacterium]
MYGESVLESLIQGIYKAAVNGAGWVAFLVAFASALNSTHPSFYLADTEDHEGSVEVSAGLDDTQRRAYREYFVHRNVWIQGAQPLLKPGSIRSSDQVCSRQVFLRSEWYADFCRPLGWRRGIGATILQEGTLTANIGAFRGESCPEYGDEDFALVRTLLPHLQRGLQMHRKLGESRVHGEALETVLHALSTPALLVAKDGSVLFINTAAERLIRTSDGLVILAGQLRALLPEDTAMLHALIGGAAKTSVRQAHHSGGTLSISRPQGRGHLQVLVSPLPAREDDWLLRQPPLAAVFIIDRYGFVADYSELTRQHGFTAAEAKVAVAISRGLAGKQICRELEISYNTLKTHVKHIYTKTHVNHQSALVRLLAGGVSLTETHAQCRNV